jgi:hypothetical protein
MRHDELFAQSGPEPNTEPGPNGQRRSARVKGKQKEAKKGNPQADITPTDTLPSTNEHTIPEAAPEITAESIAPEQTHKSPIEESQEGDDGDFEGDVVELLENVIEEFRRDQIGRFQAVTKLTNILDAYLPATNEDKDQAFRSYISNIDALHRQRKQSMERGEHAVDRHGGTAQDEGPTRSRGRTQHKHRKQRHRQSTSSSSSSSTDINGSSIGQHEGKSNKKKRVYESQMPWYDKEVIARKGEGNTYFNLTRDILDTYSKDYAFARKCIHLAKTAPRGFPANEWEHIIKGEPVDLDTVFSSLHHIAPIKENVGRVRRTEISLGNTEPARKVKTNGDWTSAWNATVKAIAFTFPHREEELREYGEHMDAEFSAKATTSHHKLISYDKAV